MSLTITGSGLATPPHSIAQTESAVAARIFVHESVENTDVLPALYRLTRVKRRGSVLLEPPGEAAWRQSFYPPAASPEDRGPGTAARVQRYAQEAPPLAIAASRRALAEAGWKGDAVTHLITVSCTGFHAPGVEFALIRELGLPPTVGRANIGFMGCHGALNGLRVASAFASDPAARVLLCAVELCSLHYYYGWDSDKVVANALFADGAAAVAGQGGGEENSDADSSWRLAACESFVLPDSADDMSWNIGDNGFEMTLAANVPSAIQKHLRGWVSHWLDRRGLTIEDVGCWAIHPGGPRIVAGVADVLNLPRSATETSLQVLAEHGNMSSVSVLFVLDRLRRAGAKLPCVALGFGPGLVAEAALFV